MPIRFSISESGRGEVLEHNLIAPSYRLFDLKPMADRAQVVIERQNADGALMGVDLHGETYDALAPSTWKKRPGSGPPLAPRGAASRVVALFRVTQEAGFDSITLRGGWPNVPWMGAHIRGKAAAHVHHLPVRNPAGIRPHGWDQLRVEFHNWVQEVLGGGPGSGPSVAPGTGGGGGPYPTTPPASPAPRPSPATSPAAMARPAAAAPQASPAKSPVAATPRPMTAPVAKPAEAPKSAPRPPDATSPAKEAVVAAQPPVANPRGADATSDAGRVPIEAFGRMVQRAADRAETGRFGESKVFINHVWDEARKDPAFGGMTRQEFDARLVEANRARVVELARADLVEAMDPADVAGSKVLSSGAEYSFVRATEGSYARLKAPRQSESAQARAMTEAAARPRETASPAARTTPERFGSSFDRLDRRGDNFVKLYDLQRELGLPRAEFHAAVREMQASGAYTLNSHEGLRGTLTQAEKDAGIRQRRDAYSDDLLVYISRRDR